MTTIIVEDEPRHVFLLRQLIEKYFPELNIIATAGSVSKAVQAIRTHRPQLVFLDVRIRRGTAFDELDQLKGLSGKYVFMTGHDAFAVRAFRYSATDYLLKPIDVDDFKEAVKKAIATPQALENKQSLQQSFLTWPNNQLTINTTRGVLVVKLEQILYLKSDGVYTIFLLDNATQIIASKNIGHYEKVLPASHYFRINRNLIVNGDKVTFFDQTTAQLYLQCDVSLKVSTRKCGKLKSWLSR